MEVVRAEEKEEDVVRIRSKHEHMREGIRSWKRQQEEDRHFQVD